MANDNHTTKARAGVQTTRTGHLTVSSSTNMNTTNNVSIHGRLSRLGSSTMMYMLLVCVLLTIGSLRRALVVVTTIPDTTTITTTTNTNDQEFVFQNENNETPDTQNDMPIEKERTVEDSLLPTETFTTTTTTLENKEPPEPLLLLEEEPAPSPPAWKETSPVIVVGFPKSGTTSVYKFFNCSGIITQHYCSHGDRNDHPPCKNGKMATCILQNSKIRHQVLLQQATEDPTRLPTTTTSSSSIPKMMQGCGNYQVYAQIDGERPLSVLPVNTTNAKTTTGKRRRGAWHDDGTLDPFHLFRHFLPQHFNLDWLHQSYPNATLILPLRDPQAWVKSTLNWFQMKQYILTEYKVQNSTFAEELQQLSAESNRTRRDEWTKDLLTGIYTHHTQVIQQFVKDYPSHKLVMFNIADPQAKHTLANAFGLEAFADTCWGHHNKKENHVRLGGVKTDE